MRGVKHGFGEYMFKNGNVMKCNWVNNKQHGTGTTKVLGEEEVNTTWENGEVITV